MHILTGALVAALSIMTIGVNAASAHTPYMKPEVFNTNADQVAAETAYSTSIFSPVVGIPAPHLSIVNPSGRVLAFGQVDVGADVSRVVAELPEQGTYRLTTGEQLGAVTPMVFDRGHWRALAPGETAPRHARTSTLQMVVTADAYVTRGAPTAISLAPAANRLAILPLSNPDAVTLGTGLDLQLLFNGQPFAYMPFVVYRPGQSEDDMSRVFVTNEQGSAHLSFDQPGLYLAVVRYRAPAPANSDARVLSYSTSITFEVH